MSENSKGSKPPPNTCKDKRRCNEGTSQNVTFWFSSLGIHVTRGALVLVTTPDSHSPLACRCSEEVDLLRLVEQAVEGSAATHGLGEHKPYYSTRLVSVPLLSCTDRVEMVAHPGIKELVERDSSRLLGSIEEADVARGSREHRAGRPSERHCQLPVGTIRRIGGRRFHDVAVRYRTVFRGFRRTIKRPAMRFGRLNRRLGRSAKRAMKRWLRRTRRRPGRSVRRPLVFLFGRLNVMRRPFIRRLGRTVKRSGIVVRGFRLVMKWLVRLMRFRRCVRRLGEIMRLVRTHGRFLRRHMRRFVKPGRLMRRLRRPIRTMSRLMRRLKRPVKRHMRLMRRLSRPMRMHGRHMRRLRLTMRRFGRPMRCTRRLGFFRKARRFGEAGMFGGVEVRSMRIFGRLMVV